MKILSVFIVSLMLASSAFAFSDTGLLNSPKSLAYFYMPRTSGTSNSSGLVYDQNINEKLDLEVLYTSYNSVYLLTNAITNLGLHGKYHLLEMGPFRAAGLFGTSLLYSSTAGMGLTGDLGFSLSLNVGDQLSISLPLYGMMMNGGMWFKMLMGVNYAPTFFPGYEAFGGYSVDMQGSSFGSGVVMSYYVFGIRAALGN